MAREGEEKKRSEEEEREVTKTEDGKTSKPLGRQKGGCKVVVMTQTDSQSLGRGIFSWWDLSTAGYIELYTYMYSGFTKYLCNRVVSKANVANYSYQNSASQAQGGGNNNSNTINKKIGF